MRAAGSGDVTADVDNNGNLLIDANAFASGPQAQANAYVTNGIYQAVVDLVTVDDVVWTAKLMSRLSDEQWNAAFAAAGYPPDQAARFIAKLKTKIAQGLALTNRSTE